MNNAVNFDGFATNHVKCKVGFNNEDTITHIFEFIISWYPPKKRMYCKTADMLVVA